MQDYFESRPVRSPGFHIVLIPGSHQSKTEPLAPGKRMVLSFFITIDFLLRFVILVEVEIVVPNFTGRIIIRQNDLKIMLPINHSAIKYVGKRGTTNATWVRAKNVNFVR